MIKKMDAIRFAIDYSAVRTAYRASREGLRERARAAERITRESWGLGPNEEFPSEPDENGWSLKGDFWVQVGEVEHESGSADEIIREAFIIGLFHLWERHANRWSGVDRYDEGKTLAELKAIGRQPNEEKLRLLKLLAHCLKHGPSPNSSGACNQLHQGYPELFEIEEGGDGNLEQPSNKNLALSEEIIEELFSAVIRSGPPASSFHEAWPLMK